MRFISAQYIAYFRNDLWKKCARHSNEMARLLADKLSAIKQVRITQRVQANGVFVVIPKAAAEKVMKRYFFYPWNEMTSEYRLMTSWDTTREDIEEFVNLLLKELKQV